MTISGSLSKRLFGHVVDIRSGIEQACHHRIVTLYGGLVKNIAPCLPWTLAFAAIRRATTAS
jgi:hypothetical protein